MRLLLIALVLAVQVPTQAPEAYPGQRNHQEPPKGFYCSPTAKDTAHRCACKRMSHPTVDDPKCCETDVVEDQACTVWCYPQKCLCPVKCEVPHR